MGQGLAEAGQELRPPLRGPGRQALVLDGRQHGAGGPAGQRIAAEGGAVSAGAEDLRRRPPRQAGADGYAVGQALGQGHDIGLDAAVLMGEELAGAAHAGLDLVEHQQPAMAVADLPQARQVVG